MDISLPGPPSLTRYNYSRWRFDMEITFEVMDCLSIVKGIEKIPVAGTEGKTEADVKAWRKLDARARLLISRSLNDEDWRMYVYGTKTSAEMWTRINEGRKRRLEMDKHLAHEAFHSYKWKKGHINFCISGLKEITDNLKELGVKMDETLIHAKVLSCYQTRFPGVVPQKIVDYVLQHKF